MNATHRTAPRRWPCTGLRERHGVARRNRSRPYAYKRVKASVSRDTVPTSSRQPGIPETGRNIPRGTVPGGCAYLRR
jgi:hypothetical protein